MFLNGIPEHVKKLKLCNCSMNELTIWRFIQNHGIHERGKHLYHECMLITPSFTILILKFPLRESRRIRYAPFRTNYYYALVIMKQRISPVVKIPIYCPNDVRPEGILIFGEIINWNKSSWKDILKNIKNAVVLFLNLKYA